MERLSWVPDDIDHHRPSAARIYDCYLGGSHNFAADREVAERIVQLVPEVPRIARANRSFLRRAVVHLLHAGIRQFLDLGSGIPTAGNVHEITQRVDPAARVVYVDIDPVAVAHGRGILAGNDRVAMVQADLRAPQAVWSDPAVRDVLDRTEPIAILMVAVLHFLSDAERPAEVIAGYRDAVVRGSYLAISHIHRVDAPAPVRAETLGLYARAGMPLTPRTEAELSAFFAGFDLVEPGLVALPEWRPDSPPDDDDTAGPLSLGFRAGVGRKA